MSKVEKGKALKNQESQFDPLLFRLTHSAQLERLNTQVLLLFLTAVAGGVATAIPLFAAGSGVRTHYVSKSHAAQLPD